MGERWGRLKESLSLVRIYLGRDKFVVKMLRFLWLEVFRVERKNSGIVWLL